MKRFVNWARTVSCTPARFARPASEDELREILRASRRVKVVGAGHSFNGSACTDGTLVSLDGMSRVLACEGDTVTVEAGIRLDALNHALAQRGLALGIVGSIARQSIAGAIATGTHGSGPRHGSLAAMVRGLRLMLADGSVRDLAPGDELFDAARVSLGALGVVTRVTLQCEPAFALEEIAQPMRFDDAVAAIDGLVRSEAYVKLWWLPHTDTVQVFRYRRTQEPHTFSRMKRWLDDRVINRIAFAALLSLSRIAPAIIPAVNRVVRAVYFLPRRTVARSDLALTIPMPPVHEEVEYAVPLERAAEALRGLRALIDRERLRVNFVAELRFVAPDEAWLSPAYGRPTAYLGAYMARAPGIDRYFALFEQLMQALGGRPHWGKQFSLDAGALRAAHPNLARFAALRDALDPEGRFDNDWLSRVLPRHRTLAQPPTLQLEASLRSSVR
ncbi:MAG TPA: D-arabinono-1,4-lactone oxidase [Myxococcales bacterium]|nr:D-arabinono-1,4-lactone oxidase [Myxococcales bacterium]